jgi:NADPH-dependent 2,4-dienoyl-CoA reductase/sulfur reductase-like enzyme/rhodanese-related sulfurtransferase
MVSAVVSDSANFNNRWNKRSLTMQMRIVVIGANAAGAKAACKAKRVNPSAEVTLIDRGDLISYGACGIPYFVSDTVADVQDLMKTPVGVVRDVQFFKKVKGVEVVTGTEAVAIDREAGKVHLVELATSKSYSIDYNRLIIATGSSPIIPPLENANLDNIFTVKSLEDAERLKERACAGKRACILGGGLVGLEMAEALKERGMKVTVIETRDQILAGILDPEIALLVEKHIRQNIDELRTSCRITGFGGSGKVEKVYTDQGELTVDLVVLAQGVEPNVKLAADAGLRIGVTGAIAVDSRMRTIDPIIYACGDCCEFIHQLSNKMVYIPLASTAIKQGRVAGINAAGERATFSGVIGTAIVKVFNLNIGRTGLLETEAKAAGYSVESVISPFPDKAHYYPGAKNIVLKLMADRKVGKIVGLQAIGEGCVDKRIDVAAAAITFGATAEQLAQLDLAYAPPYSASMDNLLVAADIMKNKLAGHGRGISPLEVKKKLDEGEDFILLDVRSPAEHAEISIDGATLIPLGMLREKLDTLPKDKEIIAFCKISLRGYEAQKILDSAGFEKTAFMDGGILSWPYELITNEG